MKKIIFIVLGLILLFEQTLLGNIINIPGDYSTIQEGINASINGDTVLVQPATYIENINYNGKNIVVGSLFLTTQDTSYISQTIIDGDSCGSVVAFENGEDSTAILTGFTITNGDAGSGGGISCTNNSSPSLKNLTITGNSADYGGGIYCYYNSNPSLDNVVITGNYADYGGGIYCHYNSNPSLDNVVIMGNSADYHGGGIYCWENSNPSLENVTITGNSAISSGGGICCYYNSNPSLDNVAITDNFADCGGGIFCCQSNPSLANATITGNSAVYLGGGIYCWANSSPSLENVTITSNSAGYGGGIYCWENSSPNLENITITGNSAVYLGGGIHCNNSSPSLENVTITGNSAVYWGGGIYCSYNSNLIFDVENRCNIYLNNISNSKGYGSDIFVNECDIINVIVDTFTVLTPTDYYTSPIDKFTFDILHSIKDSLINADLYVSVDGDDTNSGTTPDEPLKMIRCALSRIYVDSLSHNTIHLLPGVYSPSTNGENFPIEWSNYVSLEGISEEETILDADSLSGILRFHYVTESNITNISIRNGYAFGVWPMNCGGGIFCSDSSPSLENVTITGNSADKGGGIYCCYNSSPSLENVTITGNSAVNWGGGIYCRYSSPILENVIITGNSANEYGGGIYCCYNSSPSLVNVIITSNYAEYGGGIYCELYSSPSIINCILWNDFSQEIYFCQYGYSNTITISYSDIQGDSVGIVTNNNGTINWLEGNIDADPLFMDPENGDYHLSWTNFPNPDSTKSPCIDAGTPDTTGLNLPPFDLDGNPRIVNGRIDMGAYEWQELVGVDEPEYPLFIFDLFQNNPNPFNPDKIGKTTISFILASYEHLNEYTLSIYNIRGQLIKTFYGCEDNFWVRKDIEWNGTDEDGNKVTPGVYFYKFSYGDKSVTKKMILVR